MPNKRGTINVHLVAAGQHNIDCARLELLKLRDYVAGGYELLRRGLRYCARSVA